MDAYYREYLEQKKKDEQKEHIITLLKLEKARNNMLYKKNKARLKNKLIDKQIKQLKGENQGVFNPNG